MIYDGLAHIKDCFTAKIAVRRFLVKKRLFNYLKPYQKTMADGHGADKTAAVIGSGFGGLAAAIRLQSAGVHTVLYEARDKPGGRAYVYHDDGYTFDAGPTVVTAPHTHLKSYSN